MAAEPIILANQPDFNLGASTVSPAALEVTRGTNRETLEPRVMQVFVALAEVAPKVVSRDELIERCWEGRIVGEDAINRAIGRLRRLSEAGRGASFTIETIPRVGYRLVAANASVAVLPETKQAPAAPSTILPSRRTLLFAGAGAAAAAMAGGAAWLMRPRTPPAQQVPPSIAAMIAHGYASLRRAEVEPMAEAIGIFENAATQAPNVADAWGGLALAYAFASINSAPDKAEAARQRYQAAVERAFALDPHNGLAFEAKGWHYPRRGAWLESEQAFREGMKYHPEFDGLPLGLSQRMAAVGRNREAADLAQRAAAMRTELDPAQAWISINTLWAAGRLPEADQAAARGMARFPRLASVWFNNIYLLMFTGQPDAALAVLADRDDGPLGLADYNVESVALVARALKTGSAADIDKAAAFQLAVAPRGAGLAENAIMSLAALGRVDDAFAVANACYFERGFVVRGRRFSETEGYYSPVQNRHTTPLFSPPARVLRQDKRFAALVDELGLTDYWKRAGVKPDYQLTKEG